MNRTERDHGTAYDVERYLDFRSAWGPSFGPRGERLSFLFDATGARQIWTVTGPRRWPRQVTVGDERVTFVSWSPERDELIFGRDDDGNERTQLYRLDAATGTVEGLTQHPDATHRWGGWNADGSAFAFTSNRRDPGRFDVYVQDIDAGPDAAELVFESDGWMDIAGWAPDDGRLLLSRSTSTVDDDLYVLDLATGTRTHLTPHDGDVRYRSPNWGPDGESLYLVTDEGKDTLYLVRLDLESLETTTVIDGDGWNVDGVGVDYETGRLAYARNVEGYTHVTTGELTGPTTIREFPEPSLPAGVIGEMRFGPDAERFAVTVSRRREPPNVYVVDFETGNAERWTNASTAGVPRHAFVQPESVRYESFDGKEIPAFLSVPPGAVPGETPVVVDIHGGPESQRRPEFSPKTQYFLDHGYVVFEPNIRGSTGYGKAYSHLDDGRDRTDAMADLAAGVAWLGSHPAVDADRIVASGVSYGGFAVLYCLTTFPELWAGGISIAGLANLVTFLENTSPWRRELREAEYGSLQADRSFLESMSPIERIENVEVPLLVVHGENDPRVPVEEARALAERAEQTGVDIRTLLFPDEGHGIVKPENRAEAYRAIVEFVDEVCGGR